MKKSIRDTVIRLFLCVVLLLVVISCYPSSSVRAATAGNSTFGAYFGSPTTKTTAIPSTNAGSPRAATAANSTFGFYFGSPTTNANATTPTNANATTPTNANATTPTRATAKALSKPLIPNYGTDFLTPYHQGRALLNLGKYNESIAYFDKALSIDPIYYFALYNKGVALLSLGKYNESIAYFDKALSINPNYYFALYSKGVALSKLGKYNESIASFDKALAIEPSNSLALAGKKSDVAALSKTNIIASHTGTAAKTSTKNVEAPNNKYGKKRQITWSIIPSLY